MNAAESIDAVPGERLRDDRTLADLEAPRGRASPQPRPERGSGLQGTGLSR